jgi:hypothetical protein
VLGVQEAEWVQNCCTSLCLISIIMSIITGVHGMLGVTTPLQLLYVAR